MSRLSLIYRTEVILLIICFITTMLVSATQPIGGVSGPLIVTNSIIYNDTTYSQISSSVNITNSAIRGTTALPSNLSLSNYSAFKDSIALAPVNTFSYYLSPTIALTDVGNTTIPAYMPAKDLNGNDRVYNGKIDIGAVEYSEVYQNGTGNWNTATGWNIGRIPTVNDIVTIRSITSVNTSDAVCKSIISIDQGASLTISPASQLVVSVNINNAYSDRLIVKASSTQPNGTLIFHNTSSNPSATVEMYSKATWNPSGAKDDDTSTTYYYNWQFFGIPVSSMAASPTFDGSFVRKWDETGKTKSDHWVSLTNGSNMTPFNGYEITHKATVGDTIIFQGQLVNSPLLPTPLKISYYPSDMTNNALFPGQYIFANPYTAAIDIRLLKFGSGAQQTVYMYNTGSFAAWNAINGGLSSDSTVYAPGQYIAVPYNTAGTLKLPRQIPSMQAFLIRPKDITSAADYNLSFDYSTVVMKNIAQQRVPSIKDASSSEMVCTMIDVTGKNYIDRMWLFSQPGCKRNFDNGWDGAKILGDAVAPQIFAIEPDNNYQVDAVDNINNTVLGFQAGLDKDYTLTFTHQNLASKYSGVFLVDLVENKTIDITASGSTYSFSAESTPASVKRFIIATRDVEKETPDGNTQLKILITGNIVMVQNLGNQNGEMVVYDMMGRFIKKATFGPYRVTAFLVSQISGTYIVNAYTSTDKVSKKMIIEN